MIVDLVFILAALAVLIAIYKIKFSKENLNDQIVEQTKKAEQREAERGQSIEQKRGAQEQLTNTNSSVQNSRWENESESGSQGEGEQENGEQVVDRRKQLKKQQKLKEKQQRKEAQQFYLQQEKQKREKYEKESEERDRAEEERRQKEQEIIQQLRAQERKRKEEEFNKWKDMFKVQETGKEKLSQQQQKRKTQAFNRQLVALLKKNKLLLLQDLSHKFKLTTKQVVDKIRQLQSSGQISGIFDERGKYLVVQDGEWMAIRNYISARGRVKKTDIMKECARLIKIPDDVEKDLFELIKEEGA